MLDTRIVALSEEFVEVSLRNDPVAATEAGVHDYDALLADDSPDAVSGRIRWVADFERRLASVPDEHLTTTERVEIELLRARTAALRIDLEVVRGHVRNPVRPVQNALHGLFLLLARPFAPIEERKEALLARMTAVPGCLEAARASLGPVAPPVAALAAEMALRGPLFVDEIERALRPDFPGEVERIEFAGQRARLGFVEYQEAIERSAAPEAPFAIGTEALNRKLHDEHLLDLDAAALEALGRRHVELVGGWLDEEARRIDPAASWRELVVRGRSMVPEAADLRDLYEAEAERARAFVLERRIAPLPEGRLEVVETPAFARSIAPLAACVPAAPFDLEPTGAFFVTPVDTTRPAETQRAQLEAHCLPGLPITVAHEAYPGHHQQWLVSNRAPSRLRQLAWSDLFIEGWAVYCEELMHEEGFYPHPLSRLFQLQDLLFRACRVVVDVGLHTGRMTAEAAEAYLVEQAMLAPVHAEAEIRYDIVNPTQAMSYLVGKLAMLELRERARSRLGARFNLHDFHAALLGGGAIPPALVKREIDERLGS